MERLLAAKTPTSGNRKAKELAIWGHLWIDVQREGTPEAIVSRCKKSGIDTYLAYVHPLGKCFLGECPAFAYNTSIFQHAKQDLLTPLCRAARKEGIRIEPWWLPFGSRLLEGETRQEVMARTYDPLVPKEAGDKGGRKKRLPRAGTQLCATWPENRARGIRMLQDYIENHGAHLTGINMDGMRYGDSDYCWDAPCKCAACRSQYRRHFGTETITAKELELPGARYKFIKFRSQCIRELAEQARDITKKAGLRLTLSARAQVFDYAIPEGQDWPQWVRDGLLDAAFVMNYSTARAHHLDRVKQHASLVRDRGSVLYCDGVGKLSSAGENTTANLVTFATDALEAGADGISIFHYNGMKDADFAAIGALKS